MKHDLVSCATLRKGVFAAAATMMVINLVASLVYYWGYLKAAIGGFMKHQNEVCVGMTDYGLDKGVSGPEVASCSCVCAPGVVPAIYMFQVSCT
uniref:Uncharacterized protein n=1 Tax=Arundo donax TaxID=35708 RepID=A0A0A9G3L7_ARUDO